jgi:hypothetical protein
MVVLLGGDWLLRLSEGVTVGFDCDNDKPVGNAKPVGAL